MPEIHVAISKAGFLSSRFDELIFFCSSSKDLSDSRTPSFSTGIIVPNAFNMEYKKIGNDARGECICWKHLCSILFFAQYSCILPPDENAIILQSFLYAESKIERVSAVFPETLVATTN